MGKSVYTSQFVAGLNPKPFSIMNKTGIELLETQIECANFSA